MPYMDTPVMPAVNLHSFGITNENLHYQESPGELTGHTLRRKEGRIADSGALVIQTGEFTGRSPLDKFIVKDAITANTVDWNGFNIPIDERYFFQLKKKMVAYINRQQEIWIRDAQACAHPDYKLNIRVINENPWGNLFAYNMFLRPSGDELADFDPDWYVLQAPGFKADPAVDGTRQHNFSIISFAHRTILIGGSGYTGEIKKGIFSVLNYLLPQQKGVLSMHCSANIGSKNDTAIFFGLSGTGKTTLSADPNRALIGDDEHGWANNNIFNFEGGCYAKTIDLSAEKEPDIFNAIRIGALVENTTFVPGTDQIDFKSKKITENTRVSYPLHFIDNTVTPAIGKVPQNIFFLTADAYGVLPPVSKLTPQQAMYHFISGYTARVAGTEAGVSAPKATFSACFGAPFLPLHPGKYAAMLGYKLQQNPTINVWLINTGWTGGPYGTGHRIDLKYTRCMINAALNGCLQEVAYTKHPIFEMMMPQQCTGVPASILNPANTWPDINAYNIAARKLAEMFIQNFEKYAAGVNEETLAAAPKM